MDTSLQSSTAKRSNSQSSPTRLSPQAKRGRDMQPHEEDITHNQLMLQYKQSCENLSKINPIPYHEYVQHMGILIQIFQNIKTIYGVSSMSINLFDMNTLGLYQNFVNKDFKIDTLYDISEDRKQMLRLTQMKAVYSHNNLLLSTALNRAIYLNFNPLNKVYFNDVHSHNIGDYNFEYKMYTSILPKYHCLNSISFKKPNDNGIKSILSIFYELNKCTCPFTNNTIYHENNPNLVNIERMLLLKNETDMDDPYRTHALKTLIYLLINNNYTVHSNADAYYHYYEYNGSVPAANSIDINDLNNRREFQPLRITSSLLKRIIINYIGIKPHFSRPVNVAIRQYIEHKKPINSVTLGRIKNVLQILHCSDNDRYDKNFFYVFHGTPRPMHKQNTTEAYLLSFLSCTFNIYIAVDYATNNLDRRKPYDPSQIGIVYIFKVGKNIKYINFNDTLYQLLLLPGTKFTIKDKIQINRIVYFVCELEQNEDKTYLINLHDDLLAGGKKLYLRCSIIEYVITGNKMKHPKCTKDLIQVDKVVPIENVDNMYKVDNGDNSLYIFKSLGNSFDNSPIGSYFNVKYTIHQHIINDCYIYFNPNSCVEYFIHYEGVNKFYTAWKITDKYVSSQLEEVKNSVDLLLLHAFMSFGLWNMNTYYITDTSNNNQLKLIYLYGAGLYDENGIQKPTFSKTHPVEFVSILPTLSDESKQKLHANDFSYLKQLFYEFNEKNRAFTKFLEDVRQGYLNFVNNNLNIPKSSFEYGEIVSMINEVVDVLHFRSEYIKANQDHIIGAMQQSLTELNVGGTVGGTVRRRRTYRKKGGQDDTISRTNGLSVFDQMDISAMSNKPELREVSASKPMGSVNSMDISLSSYRSSRSPQKIAYTYENLRNTPLMYTNTVYHINDLKEPYKSYYRDSVDENNNVDITNAGYCVSKREFNKITKLLS